MEGEGEHSWGWEALLSTIKPHVGSARRKRVLLEDDDLPRAKTIVSSEVQGRVGGIPDYREALAEGTETSESESYSTVVFRRHDKEADTEFFVDTAIAFAILLGFAMWFAWSFWCSSKTRRSTRARRRRQERPHSLGSFSSSEFSTIGSINSSGIFQRDGHSMVLRFSEEDTQVYNPMWTEQLHPKSAAGAVSIRYATCSIFIRIV